MLVTAQDKVRFRSELGAGLLLGANNYTSTDMSLVNGLKYKTWFSGIGISIDAYGIKHSYPLYLDVQKDLSNKRKTFFIFIDGGVNFPLKNPAIKKSYWVANYEVRPGAYYQAGAGYKFPLKKSDVDLSIGYSVKEHKESYYQECDFCTPGQLGQKEAYQYIYRRIMLKLSYCFL